MRGQDDREADGSRKTGRTEESTQDGDSIGAETSEDFGQVQEVEQAVRTECSDQKNFRWPEVSNLVRPNEFVHSGDHDWRRPQIVVDLLGDDHRDSRDWEVDLCPACGGAGHSHHPVFGRDSLIICRTCEGVLVRSCGVDGCVWSQP